MALDNFNRSDALNAIVQAWTAYNSLPFITQVTASGGSSKTLQCSPLFRGVILTYGWRTQQLTMQIDGFMNNAWTYRDILSGSYVSITRSGNTITISNTDPNNNDLEIYIAALNGSIEEV